MKYGAEIPALSADDIKRFWQSVDKSECWVWTGPTRRGYGRFVIQGKAYAAHRVAWVIEHGTEPDSEVLDHTCGNPPCVNPAHLDDVTQSVNSRRGANGYGSREMCRAGLHDITDPANVREGSGGRQCRACQNAAKRRYDAKKRQDASFRASEAERRRAWGERTAYRSSGLPVRQEGAPLRRSSEAPHGAAEPIPGDEIPMSTDIPALVEALKKDAGDYRIIMEYPPTSDQLSWDQREVRAYEAAVALEREHQRAEALFRENYDLGRERDAAVQREAIQTRIAANNDRAFRSAVDRRVEIEAERDAAVQQAERAEAEVEGMLSDSTRWMNRAIPAEAQRDRYKAAIREALDIRRTANLLPAEMVYQVFRILSAALDTEKGEAS